MKTKYGTITPESIVADYAKSGLKPVTSAWGFYDEGCGCALTAHIVANDPVAFISLKDEITTRQHVGTIEERVADFLEVPKEIVAQFVYGFDTNYIFKNGDLASPAQLLGNECKRAVFINEPND